MVDSIPFSLIDYGRTVRAEVDSALASYVEFDADCPDHLRDAIRHSVLAPGKRLRPLLTLMSCEACGSSRQRAMPAACAVELIHTYSLIHDDLPAMDDDDMRRGRPSCHAKYGEATAILAGDALLARAFEILARDIEPADVAARCCQEVGHAAGASALVGGQMQDLAFERDGEGSVADLESIHRRKTGAMILASVRLGGLVARTSEENLSRLSKYGVNVGLGFQIIDDLLDVRGDAELLGKKTGKDAERGKLTFPGLIGVEESERRAHRLIDEACSSIAPLGSNAAGLEALARFVVERTH